VHLVAGSTTRPVLAQIARSELARPLVNASVERFSRANLFFTRILLQSSILHRLFASIRSVSGSASYGVQGHSVNARMQTYADPQQARASSPVLDYKFELLRTIHTGIVAVAEWYNFRIPTGYGPRKFQLKLVGSAGRRRFKSHLRAT